METRCCSKEEKLKLGKIIDNRNMQHMNSTDDDNFAASLWTSFQQNDERDLLQATPNKNQGQTNDGGWL